MKCIWGDYESAVHLDYALRMWRLHQFNDTRAMYVVSDSDSEHIYNSVLYEVVAGKPETVTNLTPVALQRAVWDNSKGTGTGTFKAQLSDTITDSTTVGWSESKDVGASFGVSIEVGFAGNKASASANYSMDVTKGESKEHTKERSVGQESAVDYEVDAGNIDLGVLMLQSGKISIRVPFTVEYGGHFKWNAVDDTGEFKYQGTQGMSVLAPYLPRPNLEMTMECDFSDDALISVIQLDGDTPDDISDGVNRALKAAYPARR